MKHTLTTLTIILAFGFCIQSVIAADLDSEKAKTSYSIGVDVGNNFLRQEMDLDIDALVDGLKDAYKKQALKMSEAEIRDAKIKYQTEMRDKRMAKEKAQASVNIEGGKKFMEDYKKKEGVKTTDSGLLYREIKMGDGAKPGPTDRVSVHYRGTLTNGEEFDSSYTRGQPVAFGVNQVIKGWTEGLQLMPVGSKFEFVIPSDLAYGDRGAGAKIGPGATLVFEVELLGIE